MARPRAKDSSDPTVRELFLLAERAGRSVNAAAAEADVCDRAISSWKGGHALPRIDHLAAVGRALGLRLAWVPAE